MAATMRLAPARDLWRDPVWRRLQTIFGFYGVPQHLAETHGRGSVRGQSGPENTHCNNIGPGHRISIHAAFARWFQIGTPPPEAPPRHTVEELTCLTPPALATRPIRPLHQLAGRLGEERARRGLDAVRALPEVHRVQVLLEDPLLGVLLLQVVGDHRLVDLPVERHGVAGDGVLHELLGDGRPALDDPSLYLHPLLSLLEFNRRVLAQGEDRSLPLLERLRFLTIFSSNLDEFFEVRVSA